VTYSIVARDLETQTWGVAVQSKFVAIGAVTPWARAGVGAIATQAWINTTYGPEGLALLASGLSAQETVERLTQADAGRNRRQVGVIGREGQPAIHTGSACPEWAGGIVGAEYACQGNTLVGQETVEAMAQAFERSVGPLWERLMAALAAGQAAGGDRRGQQSTALLMVREGAGFRGFDDRMIDLRVDDHPSPIEELGRILRVRLEDTAWAARE
jgi:uncharacterized Ntn-hydrolase superfamily protein